MAQPSWRVGLNLPFRTGGSLCASKIPDAQAAYESANTLNTTVLAGTNFVLHAAGWLEGGLASCYEKFMMDIDQLGMHQKLAQGVDLVGKRAGDGRHRRSRAGQPLSWLQPHPGEFPRDRLLPLLHRRQQLVRAVAGGRREARRRTRQSPGAQKWLETYEQPDLDHGIHDGLRDFMAKKKESMPDAFT